MNDFPVVSVLTTVYNREKYLAEAIESILNQSYDDWELIIVDDQSKDNSVEIARHYEKLDSRIRVFVNEKNLGDYPNRNKAASYARGKYIKYLDADDMLYPHALGVMVSCMEAFPESGWGVTGPDPKHRRFYPFITSCQETWINIEDKGFNILNRAPLSLIIKRDLFFHLGGFSGRQHIGDFELLNILACYSPMVAIPGELAWYRVHPDQQSQDNRSDLFVPFKYLKAGIELMNSLPVPLETERINKIINRYRHKAGFFVWYSILHGRYKTAKKMLLHMNWSIWDAIKHYMFH